MSSLRRLLSLSTGGLAVAAVAVCAGCGASTETPGFADLADSVRAEPLLARTPTQGVNVFGDAPPGATLTASGLLHLIRVAGLGVTVDVRGEPIAALDVLTSGTRSEELFGDPALIRTRTGLRFPPLDERFRGAGDEGHRGLCLAAMAEMGVSLDRELELDGDAFTLRDVLRDTLAEFHERQAELEWTATALVRWLPPHDRWRNRFGATCTLSSLAEELLTRPLWDASCAGTHRLIALSTMLAANGEHPFLGADLELRLRTFLDDAVDVALRTQESDGSWTQAWMTELLPEDERGDIDPRVTPMDRLLVTGHLSEWLARYRDRELVSAALERGARRLERELAEIDRDTAWSAVCPVTHAVVAVRENGTAPRQVAPFLPGDVAGFVSARPVDASSNHQSGDL